MSKTWTPHPWQSQMLRFALHDGAMSLNTREMSRCNLWAAPGTGKTSTGYGWYDALYRLGYARRVLILAPLRVALNSWAGEREKWLSSFGHMDVAIAIGNPKQRLAAVNRFAHVTVTNYESVEWLVDLTGDRWPWDSVIADESSRLKGLRVDLTSGRGQGAVRARKLITVAHKRVRNWLNLTGSPASNGIQDTWGQQAFVDGGAALGTSSGAFFERWFHTRDGPSGRTELRPMAHADGEIKSLLRPTTLTVKLPFDPGKVHEIVVPITLPPKARRVYDELQDQLFSEIAAGVQVQVFDPAGLSNKCLQVACGTVFYEPGIATELHDEKLMALESIIADLAGAPLLVRYTFTPDRDRILKRFPFARFLDKKPATVRAFQEGDIRVLVTHAASAGHGLDLQHNCHHMVDYGCEFNLEFDEQIVERIGPVRQWQIGRSDRLVTRYRLIATGTIEETAVLPRIRTKGSVQESLKMAMSRC